MKRLVLLILIMSLTLVAAQCGGQQAVAPTAVPPTAAAPKVAAPTDAPKAVATIAPAVPKATDAPKVAATAPAAPKATDAPKAAAGGTLGTAANPVKMAFVPSADTAKILLSGDKIGKLLEEKTGLRVQVSVPTSYAAVVEAMNAGQVDVAWLAPASYVVAANRYGVELMLTTVRTGSKTYPFSFIVLKDSPIQSVQDMKGKKLAGQSELSTSGNLYPRAYLMSQGIQIAAGDRVEPDKVTMVYSGGHDRSIIAVLNGQADVAAVFGEFQGTADARNNVKATVPDVYEKTRVLLNSADVKFMIPNDTVSARKDLPADIKTKVRDGLLAVAQTEEGVKELKALYNIDGLVIGDPKDYTPIEEAARAANIDLGQAIAPPRPAATAAPSGGTAAPSGTPRP